MIERLDANLEQTFEVQLTWLKREDISNGVAEPTPDEVLLGRIEVVVDAWAAANEVMVQDLTVVDGRAVVALIGSEPPDASGLIESIDELFGTIGDVQVLFTQRLDITTTTTIARSTNTPN